MCHFGINRIGGDNDDDDDDDDDTAAGRASKTKPPLRPPISSRSGFTPVKVGIISQS